MDEEATRSRANKAEAAHREGEMAQSISPTEIPAQEGSNLEYPASLLGNPALKSRGNSSVRAAILQGQQHALGNRGVQRLVQRTAPSNRATKSTLNLVAQPREGGPMPGIAVQRQPRPRDGGQPAAGALLPGEQEFNEGVQMVQTGDYEEAIAVLERARRVPGAPPGGIAVSLFNIGVCNFRLRRYAMAVTYYEMALNTGARGQRLVEIKVALEEARRMADLPGPNKNRATSAGTPQAAPAPAQRAVQRQESAEPDEDENAPQAPHPIVDYEGS